MNVRKVSLLGILFYFVLNSVSLAAGLKEGRLQYNVSVNGISVASDIRTLVKKSEYYLYTSEMKTVGIARLFKNYKIMSKSKFIVTTAGIESLYFSKEETKKEKIELSVDLKARKAVFQNKSWTLNASQTIVDDLNIVLAISYMLQLAPNGDRFCFQVLDGKRIVNQCYSKDNKVFVKDEQDFGKYTANQDNKTMLVFKKEFKTDARELILWFDKTRDYLMYKIIQKEKDGDTYEYELDE